MTGRISEQHSAFLHMVRIYATAAVIIGHATRPDILFDVDISIMGRATIPTFLMISAYFSARTFTRSGTFVAVVGRRYLSMYFVFLPAAVAALLMDLYMIEAGSIITTKDKFDPDMSLGRIAIEFFEMLTFSGEYWSISTVGQGVFSNEAMWIMDYIMAYTVATAALYILRGWQRIAALLVICVIAGPTVVLMAPLWFTGILAFEIDKRLDEGLTIRINMAGTEALKALIKRQAKHLALLTTVGAVILIFILEGNQLGESLYQWSKTIVSYDYRQYLGMAKRFAWQYVYLPTMLAVFVAARFLFTGGLPGPVRAAIELVSKYCLPLFAIHFTLMYLFATLIPDYTPSWRSPDPYLMLSGTTLAGIAFGWFCFRFSKPVFDGISRRLFTRPSAVA